MTLRNHGKMAYRRRKNVVDFHLQVHLKLMLWV